MELHIVYMIYAHEQKRRHFHAKMTSAKLYIYIGLGARDMYIHEADTALDIFRFAVFFSIAPERTNSSLQTGLRSNGYSVPEKSIFQQRMVCWESFVFGLLTASEATDVSRVLQGCLKDVSSVSQGCLKLFQGHSKDVSRVFKCCFKDFFESIKGYFKAVPMVFQECFKSILGVF